MIQHFLSLCVFLLPHLFTLIFAEHKQHSYFVFFKHLLSFIITLLSSSTFWTVPTKTSEDNQHKQVVPYLYKYPSFYFSSFPFSVLSSCPWDHHQHGAQD